MQLYGLPSIENKQLDVLNIFAVLLAALYNSILVISNIKYTFVKHLHQMIFKLLKTQNVWFNLHF